MTSAASIVTEFKNRVGDELGVSNWVTITQDMIDRFGDVTLDPDPMHIDPEWCEKNSPFGSTVAFGFLTMSLLISMLHDVMQYRSNNEGGQPNYGLNYGFDRLRLIAPVPVNSRIRGRFVLAGWEERNPGEFLQQIDVTVEIEGQDKPALVGRWLSIFVSDDEGHGRIAGLASEK